MAFVFLNFGRHENVTGKYLHFKSICSDPEHHSSRFGHGIVSKSHLTWGKECESHSPARRRKLPLPLLELRFRPLKSEWRLISVMRDERNSLFVDLCMWPLWIVFKICIVFCVTFPFCMIEKNDAICLSTMCSMIVSFCIYVRPP